MSSHKLCRDLASNNGTFLIVPNNRIQVFDLYFNSKQSAHLLFSDVFDDVLRYFSAVIAEIT